eukprot:m.1461476 g.1461476  ORF g.1461476 m.1461476 type:complete len:212 (-) comp25132_c1_seq4:1731-2366(-)
MLGCVDPNVILLLTGKKSSDLLVVGVLDIFGFENFEVNSFEQLCINTANEQLQFFFNEHIFRWEIDEMKREGVASIGCDFTDNRPQVDVLLARPDGLFAVLDEESSFPRSTDDSVLHKFHNKQGHNTDVYDSLHSNRLKFKLHHYAGAVEYTIDGFLEKNRNAPCIGINSMISKCKLDLVRVIFHAAEPASSPSRAGVVQQSGHALCCCYC